MTRPTWRRHLPGAIALWLAAWLLAASPAPAAAHGVLIASDPADGAALSEAPTSVHLRFSEAVIVEYSSASLADGKGRAYDVAVAAEPDDSHGLLVSLPTLPSGTYRLTWHTVSRDDLHVTSGWTVFSIREPAPAFAGGSTPAGSDVAGGLLAWAVFGGLAMLAGSALVLALLLPPGALGDRARPRVVTFGLAAAMVAIAVNGAVLVRQAGAIAPGDPSQIGGLVIDSGYGQRWLVEELALVVTVVALVAWRGRGRAGVAGRLGLIGAIALIFVTRSLSSHVAAAASATPVDVALGAIHAAAAATWIGALVVLVLTLAGGDRSTLLAALRRFGPYAAASLALSVLTGLLLAGQLVASLDALLLTDYGHLLLVKLGIAGVAAAIGLRHAARLHASVRRAWRGMPGHRLLVMGARAGSMIGTLRVEALAVIGVALLAALLTMTPPANGPEFRPASAPLEQPTMSGTADDLLLTAAVRPARAGDNFVTLGVYETRRPSLAPIDEVRVELVPVAEAGEPLTLVAKPLGDGRYETPAGTIAFAGDWELRVSVHRAGLPDAVYAAPIGIDAATAASRATVVASWPLGPVLAVLALTIAAGMAVGLSVILRRRRRRPLAPAFLPVLSGSTARATRR
jgi:copper transport protein